MFPAARTRAAVADLLQWEALERRQEITDRDLEGAGQSEDDEESGFLFARLESADVVLVEVRGFRECFLGPAAGFS